MSTVSAVRRRSLDLLLTYLLTPWCTVLLEQLTGLQLVKKFPAFHGTRRFITALKSVRHLPLSRASPIQSIYPHPTSWRSILILFTHLRLGLPSGLLPSGFPTKTLYTPLSSPIRSRSSYVSKIGARDSSVSTVTTEWTTEETWFEFDQEQAIYPFSEMSTPGFGVHPALYSVRSQGCFSRGQSGREREAHH